MKTKLIGSVMPQDKGQYKPTAEYVAYDSVFYYNGTYLWTGEEPTSIAPTEEGWVKIAEIANREDWTWDGVQDAVRSGESAYLFPVGTQFSVDKGGVPYIFQVVDIGSSTKYITANGNAPTDSTYFTQFPLARPLTLESLRVTYGVMFSAPQASYNIVTEIPSGSSWNIKLALRDVASNAVVQYDFTAPAHALVVGGLLQQTSATNMKYYANAKATGENITITAGTTNAVIDDKLSVLNDFTRILYGSNKYSQSALRQYLLSGLTAGSYWQSQTIYDLKPSWESSLAGFQRGMDTEFLSIIGLTTREVEMNTITDNGTAVPNITLSDKFFLSSRKEVFGDAENAGHKGTRFDLYVGSGNVNRIRYDITNHVTPRYWWLRSPYAGSSYAVRYVGSDGTFYNYNARIGVGVAPACVIL